MKSLRQLNGLYSMGTGNVNTPVGNGALIIKKAHNQEAPNNGVVLEFGNSVNWVGQLYIGDNAYQGIYYNGWADGVRGNWRRLADEPVSLYDNSSGTTGTVTLSETAANFDYLEIFYRDSDKHYNSVKIASPNGKEAWLSGGYIESNASGNVKYKNVTVSGTSITSKNYIQVAFNGGDIVINNYIYITKVVGYK